MILTKITLTIEDKEFDIRHFNYHFCRDTDAKGRPSSRYYGGMFFIEIESLPENYLMSRLVSFEQMLVSGKIEVWANDGEQCIRRIEFEKAYIYHHEEEMKRYQSLPMLTTIAISPLRLDINKKVRIDRRISDTNNGFWDKYVPPKEEKSKQQKETIYVKKVDGKSSATAGDEVKYRVTKYTQEGITEEDKKDIKWVVSVEGKRTNLVEKGEVITLTIKPEWAGKEIIVMPYLHSSTERVSVKTKINLKDGVFLWTEIKQYGHAFISVHYQGEIYVYTYGRYDNRSIEIVARGVLIRYTDTRAINYIKDKMYQDAAMAFEVKDVLPQIVIAKFDNIWQASTKHPTETNTENAIRNQNIKEYGRVIDTYILFANNCTTYSCTTLIEAGTKIFDQTAKIGTMDIETNRGQIKQFPVVLKSKDKYINPSSLQEYLSTSKNKNIENSTLLMHQLFSK